MMEEDQTNPDHPNQLMQSSQVSQQNTQYYANINQLIAQPTLPTKTQQFLTSLYNLSSYLFRKKNTEVTQSLQISFQDYLNSVADQFSVYDNIHKKAKKQYLLLSKSPSNSSHTHNSVREQSQLVQCFKKVPYIFFQQKFILDFGQLSKSHPQIRTKQQQLNEQLDLVQINLFTQIHYKFHDYFHVVTNFDYLDQVLQVNINKIMQSRQKMRKVKSQFIDKSVGLRKRIIHRQNLQKTIKLIKITKSLKKLPTIINQILMSSLPYQCLSLLNSTKQSLSQVANLSALTKISQTIKQSQNLVQMGLNKRYADQLYLYLQQCQQQINLQQHWQRINSHNCMDISGINNSFMNNSVILEQSFLQMQPTCNKNKRNQGKQFQIAMIIIQSYKYIQFPQDLTRIKISNSLRIFLKKFDNQLGRCLYNIMQVKKNNMNMNNSRNQGAGTTNMNNMMLNSLKQQSQSIQKQNKNNNKQQQQSRQLSQQFIQKITVIFYVKHLFILNQIMKQTINRLLGFFHTLVLQYQQQQKTNKNKNTQQNHHKFLMFLKQQLTCLPTICKIIVQKVKSLMVLKNVSGINLMEFKQWIGLLDYWEKYIQSLIQENQFVNYSGSVKGVQDVVNQMLRKMVTVMNIKQTTNQLSFNFVTSYHTNISKTQLNSSLIDQSWQSVQIPSQFTQVINTISQWSNPLNSQNNMSITILNQSGGQLNNSNRSISFDKKNSSSVSAKNVNNKFRVLKNNVLVDGSRYKVSVSFLLLCQFIDEYIKMGKQLTCTKFVYERMFDLIDYYNTRSKQLILQAKARNHQKMKMKNISAKHLCLVHNCVTLLQKLLKELKKAQTIQLKQLAITTLEIHRKKIIQKLSILLKSKIQSIINNFLITKQAKISQVNLNILNTLVQMMNIADQYLQFEDRKDIFKYFKQLLLRGKQLVGENKLLVQKLMFLKQYFPEELEVMDKQVAKIQKM